MWYEIPGLSQVKKTLNPNDDALYLDFGHGGSDSGCIFYDKLRFGLAVLEIVKPHIKKIVTTRTNDKTVKLETIAKNMSDLAFSYRFVEGYSLHCNAFNTSSYGAEMLLSSTVKKDSDEYSFSASFLKTYSDTFGIFNRGIKQKTGDDGSDYYCLHRETPNNCSVKFIEFFFGDNREDCKKAQTQTFFDKATFLTASFILKRFGIELKPVIESKVRYLVQCGAFTEKVNAAMLEKKLKSKGFDAVIKTEKII
jgi:N-acetylmuramoyl-L-alanine amidase